MPLKECTLGAPSLGMAMDVVGPDGEHLPPGEVGELVCRKPWPSMTRGVWGDPAALPATRTGRAGPGVWVHGDWASVDEDGYWYLHGRSDDTLNIAGKRIGPAEFESAAVAHPARGRGLRGRRARPGQGRGGLAVLRAAARRSSPTTSCAAEVRDAVTAELGKAFAPARIGFVTALPKTRSAKIVRRAVRAAALGDDPGDLSSLEDPAVLDQVSAREVSAGAVLGSHAVDAGRVT